ncbi:hypothetical protein F4803DRAFT_510212 [Xylaria telfairii]|nr:hypothetical protein F4803DRAFT_510212 [Xylaria telfairii]
MECQPRRAGIPKYTIPEFMMPLLPWSERQRWASSLSRKEPPVLRPDMRPSIESPVVNEATSPPSPRQNQNLASSVPTKSTTNNGFAGLLRRRQRPLRPPHTVVLPSTEPSTESIDTNIPTYTNTSSPPSMPFSNLPSSQTVSPPRTTSTWIHRNVAIRTRRQTPAYENREGTAEYAGFNTSSHGSRTPVRSPVSSSATEGRHRSRAPQGILSQLGGRGRDVR